MKELDTGRFAGRSIALLGLGSENLELARWLIRHKAGCSLTVCDRDSGLKGRHGELGRALAGWRLGPDYDKDLGRFDLVSRVAGYPLFSPALEKAVKKGAATTSPVRLFFELCPTKNIIGVTGTKGKGTTSALIVEMLGAAGKKAFWGGNVGIPLFSFLDKIGKNDWAVLELSSFQLEDLDHSPHIAVLTNLSREHLRPADPKNPNYHLSYEDYISAKLNIFRHQGRDDFAVINRKTDLSPFRAGRGKAALGKGKKVYFTRSDYPTRLPGEHNRENIAAAASAASLAGAREAVIKKAVRKFKGLEHRLEFAGRAQGVEYYDDSFATTPESSIIALRSFAGPVVLLAGGADKGADYGELAREIRARVKALVLFAGSATPRLEQELAKAGYPAADIRQAGGMKEAFALARQSARQGDVVLLSPAAASFGLFNNYKERGNLFKQEVKRTI